jgi:DNA-binding NarL/FixJ family response regulator
MQAVRALLKLKNGKAVPYMTPNAENAEQIRTLSVLLADDHARVLAQARELLDASYRIVAAVTDGEQALKLAKQVHPDIIVLDIAMPKMDGLQTARALRALGCTAKILFLTVLDDEAYITAARAVADGYVLKSRMYSDLRHAIEEAVAGRFFLSTRQVKPPR